jgi:hypothetical protein
MSSFLSVSNRIGLSMSADTALLNGNFNLLFRECTNPRRHFVLATKFYTVASNISGSSVWNLLDVTLLVPRSLRLLVDFLLEKCGIMTYKIC